LVLGGEAGFPAIKDTGVRVYELHENLSIFIVDELNIILVEMVLFFHKWIVESGK